MHDLSLSQQIKEAVAAIRERTDLELRAGVVLGTGLGSLPDALKIEAVVPYEEIPHFPRSQVESHANELVLGSLKGCPVALPIPRRGLASGRGAERGS